MDMLKSCIDIFPKEVLETSNQIVHYTRCITPKRFTSLQAHIRVIVAAGNTALLEKSLQRLRSVGNSVTNLIGKKFELQSSQLRDVHVSVWVSTGQ